MATKTETDSILVEYVSSHAEYCDGQYMEERKQVLVSLETVIKDWVLDYGKKQNVKEDILLSNGTRLLPFGGQQVGIASTDSDIDAVCVVPCYVKRKAFFNDFPNVISGCSDVTHLRVIEAAYVPVIKLTYQHIEFDICLAVLQMDCIPPEQDLLPLEILKGMDVESVRSINGVRETLGIVEIVQDDFNKFVQVVKIIKFWAKRKGVYGAPMGYLGGIGWTILVAFCIQKHKDLSVANLLQQFFYTVGFWPWPKAILLKPLGKDVLNLKPWNAQINTSDQRHTMPIITPVYPEHNCSFTVCESTKKIIRSQLQEACAVVDAIMEKGLTWDSLFIPAPFFSTYKHFLMITTKSKTQQAHTDWSGLVHAKLRLLVSNLEKQSSIVVAHPCVRAFSPTNPTPDIFQSIWFIGLQFDKATGVRLDLAGDIQNFSDTLYDAARIRHFSRKDMKLDVKHVKRKQIDQFITTEDAAI